MIFIRCYLYDNLEVVSVSIIRVIVLVIFLPKSPFRLQVVVPQIKSQYYIAVLICCVSDQGV